MSVTDGFSGVPWIAWGGVCPLLAAVYLVVWPRPKRQALIRGFWRRSILRWAHGAVWLVLAASFFLRIADWPGVQELASALALVGGLLYATFAATIADDRLRHSRP